MSETTPREGQWLYASCAGETYGKVVRVGVDENGSAVLDIELQDPDVLADAPCMECDEDPCEHVSLLRVEISPGAVITLRDVLWRSVGQGLIECRTPGNGCARCTKVFSLVGARVPRRMGG